MEDYAFMAVLQSVTSVFAVLKGFKLAKLNWVVKACPEILIVLSSWIVPYPRPNSVRQTEFHLQKQQQPLTIELVVTKHMMDIYSALMEEHLGEIIIMMIKVILM